MQIELHHVAAEDGRALASLMQQYLHDMAGRGGVHADVEGRQPAESLDLYWSSPGRSAFLIGAEGRVAGFALVHQHSRLHGPFDGHVVEALFIVGALRRCGVGGAAAAAIFEHFPGRWEIATPAANVPATAFWRAISHRYTHGAYEELWYQHNGWRGTIESFATPPRA